jgi:DNA-binding PadR family transcriptional regulator
MTQRRTTTTYAILGLLSVQTWTSYELAKQVQRSLRWFWPRAERKLYDEPKRLVADGLATATKESTGKRPRTVYGITDAGREELRRWLGDPPAPPTIEFEGLVKIFFAEAGSLDQLKATLDAIADEATARLESLADMAESGVASPNFPERMHIGALPMRLSLEHEVTVLRWVAWAREQVAIWSDAGDPGEWDAATALTDLAKDARAAVAD